MEEAQQEQEEEVEVEEVEVVARRALFRGDNPATQALSHLDCHAPLPTQAATAATEAVGVEEVEVQQQ